MFTHINRVIFLILITLICTACTYSEKTIPSNNIPSNNIPSKPDLSRLQVNTMTSATISITGAHDIPIDYAALSAPHATDKASMENIMNNPGLARCEKMTDLQLKEKCTDNLLYSKATLAKSSKLCNEIKDKKLLGTCIVNSIDISSTEKDTNPCTMSDIEIQKSCIESMFMQQALSAMDSNLCAKIADFAEQNNCKITIIMTQALKNKDEMICLKLDDLAQQKNCKDMFDQQSKVNIRLNQ